MTVSFHLFILLSVVSITVGGFFNKKPHTDELSDLDLLAEYKKNYDTFFVGELFKRYSHFVFGVCKKYLKDDDRAEEEVMQVFEKLFDVLKRHEVSSFKSWLGTLTRNHCLTLLSKSNKAVSNLDEVNEARSVELDVDPSLIIKKELELNQLEKAVKELNKEQRLCIELFYLKNKSYKEIVQETAFDVKEVKSFIQNGKRNLKNMLLKMKVNE